MSGWLTALAVPVVVGAIAAIPVLVCSAVADAVGVLRRRPESTPRWWRLGAKLVGAVLLSLAPVVATSHVERANHWVDADDNGVLDPMANGGYDWVDVNGGGWMRWWALLAAPVLAVALGDHIRRMRSGV